MNFFRILSVWVLLGAFIGTGIYYFVTQDAREIKNAWTGLLAAVEKTEPGNRIVNLARANRVPDFFAEPFMVDATPHGGIYTDREELRSQALALAEYATRVSFDYEIVELLIDSPRALMIIDGSAEVIYDHRTAQFEGTGHVHWLKTDEGWKSAQVMLED